MSPSRPFNIAIRHAQSEVQGLSIEEKCRFYREKGDANIKLSAKGLFAALKFGLKLFPHGEYPLLRVYHGDDRRCAETAQLIVAGIKKKQNLNPSFKVFEQQKIQELTKQDFGDLDGYLTSAERKKYAPEAYDDFNKALRRDGVIDARPTNGESYQDLADRLSRASERISDDLYSYSNHHNSDVAGISITNGTNVLILRALARGEPLENIIPYIDKVKNLKGFDLTY